MVWGQLAAAALPAITKGVTKGLGQTAGSAVTSVGNRLLAPLDGAAQRAQADAAFPGTNPWEQLGGGASAPIQQQREQSRTQLRTVEKQGETAVRVAETQARATVDAATISAGGSVRSAEISAEVGHAANKIRASLAGAQASRWSSQSAVEAAKLSVDQALAILKDREFTVWEKTASPAWKLQELLINNGVNNMVANSLVGGLKKFFGIDVYGPLMGRDETGSLSPPTASRTLPQMFTDFVKSNHEMIPWLRRFDRAVLDYLKREFPGRKLPTSVGRVRNPAPNPSQHIGMGGDF